MKITFKRFAYFVAVAVTSLAIATAPNFAQATDTKPTVFNISNSSFGDQCVVSGDNHRLGWGPCSSDAAYWVISNGVIMNSDKSGKCRDVGGYLVVDKSSGALVMTGGCAVPNSQWGAAPRQPSGWLIWNVSSAKKPALTYANFRNYGPSFFLTPASNQMWGSQTWNVNAVQ